MIESQGIQDHATLNLSTYEFVPYSVDEHDIWTTLTTVMRIEQSNILLKKTRSSGLVISINVVQISKLIVNHTETWA